MAYHRQRLVWCRNTCESDQQLDTISLDSRWCGQDLASLETSWSHRSRRAQVQSVCSSHATQSWRGPSGHQRTPRRYYRVFDRCSRCESWHFPRRSVYRSDQQSRRAPDHGERPLPSQVSSPTIPTPSTLLYSPSASRMSRPTRPPSLSSTPSRNLSLAPTRASAHS